MRPEADIPCSPQVKIKHIFANRLIPKSEVSERDLLVVTE